MYGCNGDREHACLELNGTTEKEHLKSRSAQQGQQSSLKFKHSKLAVISLDADYFMKSIGCWTPDQVGEVKRLGKRVHFDKGLVRGKFKSRGITMEVTVNKTSKISKEASSEAEKGAKAESAAEGEADLGWSRRSSEVDTNGGAPSDVCMRSK